MTDKKLITKLIEGLLLMLLLVSCSQDKVIKIGLLIPATKGSRWPTDQRYMEKICGTEGVEIISLSAENDENIQIKQAHQLLKQDVDVLIIIAVNSNTSAGIVREAHDHNIPVIAYDRLIMNSDVDYLVTYKTDIIAQQIINSAISEVPKGNYVFLWGHPGDVNAKLLKQEQEKILRPLESNNDINIVYRSFVDDWNENNAYHLMKKILTYSDKRINAIVSSSDGLSYGAIRALEEENYDLSDVYITGQNAELRAVQSIANNGMNMTVYKPFNKLARACIHLAIQLASQEKIHNANQLIYNGRNQIHSILLESIIVTKDNIAETVIADGLYTKEQILKKSNDD